ncbi:MAG: hypothetical protein HY818_18080 [Acetobacterium woodii]|nr:hypothetical protein [Acetobacterium woodii]
MCEYCQGGKKLPSQDINKKYDLDQYPDSGIKAIVDGASKSMKLSAFCNANEISRLKGGNNGASDVVDINYCPMCGDELGKEKS